MVVSEGEGGLWGGGVGCHHRLAAVGEQSLQPSVLGWVRFGLTPEMVHLKRTEQDSIHFNW